MGEISREEIQRLYATLDDGFRGVHSRLDTMNGRVSGQAAQIAVLEALSSNSKDATSRWISIGALFVGVGEFMHRWLSK